MNDTKDFLRAKIIRNKLCLTPKLIQKYRIITFKGGEVNGMIAVQFITTDASVVVSINQNTNLYEIWTKDSSGKIDYQRNIYDDELWNRIEYSIYRATDSPKSDFPEFVEQYDLEVVPKGQLYILCEQAGISLDTYLDGPYIISLEGVLESFYANLDYKIMNRMEQVFFEYETVKEKLQFLSYMFQKIFN